MELSEIETRGRLERFEVITYVMLLTQILEQKMLSNVTYDDITKPLEEAKQRSRDRIGQPPGSYSPEEIAADMDILTAIEAKIATVYAQYATLDQEPDSPGKEPRR